MPACLPVAPPAHAPRPGNLRDPTRTRNRLSLPRAPTALRRAPGTSVPAPPSALRWQSLQVFRSCACLLVRRLPTSLSFLDSRSKAVEPCLPQALIACQPPLKRLKRLRPEGVQAALPVRPNRDEPRLAQDAQMARDAGLVNPGLLDDVVDLLLARPQCVDDMAPGRIGQGLEGV